MRSPFGDQRGDASSNGGREIDRAVATERDELAKKERAPRRLARELVDDRLGHRQGKESGRQLAGGFVGKL